MEERILIFNSKGDQLVGYHYRGKSSSIIVGCHGTHNYSSIPQAKEIFAYYQALGFSTFRFDFAGYGESQGRQSVLQRVDDIQSAITVVGNEYKEIIISAISLGAFPSAIAVANDKRITKFIVTNGVFNFEEIHMLLRVWIQFHLFLHKEARKEKELLEAMLAPDKIAVPTLVLYCENDTLVNPKQSKDFFAKLRTERKLASIPHADHYSVVQKDIAAVINNTITSWLAEYKLPQ